MSNKVVLNQFYFELTMNNMSEIKGLRKNILIINKYYIPGYKSGGPVRTVENLTSCFGDRFNFSIICLNRDLGDSIPYPNVKANEWTQVGKARVLYVKRHTMKFIYKYVKENDLVYCCGGFENYSIMSMLLKRLGIIKKPVYVASMGVFSPGALSRKSFKKKAFVFIGKLLGLFNAVSWSVSAMREENELKEVLGQNVETVVAENLPRNDAVRRASRLTPSALKIVFIARISPKKNLLGAIEILKGIKDKEIVFDIYGNIQNKQYWDKCLDELRTLPSNIKWNYCGFVDSKDILACFARYDVFLFPTLGENFGHVISEAMLAGCIPVISDTTPWLDLEENGCGYVVPLSDTNLFVKRIEEIAALNVDELNNMSQSVQSYIKEHNRKSLETSGYLRIFETFRQEE